MRVSSKQLIADFEAGKKASLARVISIVENHRDDFEDMLATLHPRIGTARRIALVAEGCYPFVTGGVSTWCDQLIRGLPDHDFEVVALTATQSRETKSQLGAIPKAFSSWLTTA